MNLPESIATALDAAPANVLGIRRVHATDGEGRIHAAERYPDGREELHWMSRMYATDEQAAQLAGLAWKAT